MVQESIITTGLSRKEIKSGMIWNAIELYSSQVMQFAIGVIMARLLMPDDYAIIGMITVFICISNVLISSGFSTALLRKKHCTSVDYSTVFYFNILISLVLYIILWFCSPLIADFYGYPILTPVTRYMGLTFLVGSISSVSETILKRELRFRIIALITLVCSLATGLIAIYFAFTGYGVWALVIQAILASILRTIIVFIAAKWHPILVFSKHTFQELFGFGSKLLGSNIVTQLYQNMYNILIGKFFSAASLAYFTRADGYSRLVPINISGVLQKALFPMLSKIQDNNAELEIFNRKMTSVTSFLIFPASLLLAGVAYPLISIMLTDKWIDTAPILQILCIAVLPDHLYCINNDFILIGGRSDYIMKEQIYTKIISVIILIVSLPFGIMWVAVGRGLGAMITWLFSVYYLKKCLKINFLSILSTIGPMFISSLILGSVVAWSFTLLSYTIVNVFVVVSLFCGVYLLTAKILFPQSLMALINFRK